MPDQPAQPSIKRATQWLLPVLVSGTALYLIARQIDPAQMQLAFRSLTAGNILLILVFFFLGQVLRAWAWKMMLGPNFDLKTAFFTMNAGYLLNNILPFRMGEIGRGLLLSGKGPNKAPFMEVLASIMTERILDIFFAAVLMLSTLPLVVKNQNIGGIALAAFLLAVGGMVIAGIMAARRVALIAWLGARLKPDSWFSRRLLPKLDQFLVGFEFFNKPDRIIITLVLLGLSWLTAVAEVYIMQNALVQNGQVWWPPFVLSAGAFAMALPSAPAGLGVYEAAIVGAYALVGVDQSISIVIAIVLHLVQTLISSGLGLIGLTLMGKNFKELVDQASKRRTTPQEVQP